MYEITIVTDFSSAHSLRDYKGKCEALHGHNWKVEVSVEALALDSIGIAMDFKVLKDKTRAFLEYLDHRHINEIPPFDRINPSAENLARFIFERLSERINSDGVKVSKVKVWESDDSCATYYPD